MASTDGWSISVEGKTQPLQEYIDTHSFNGYSIDSAITAPNGDILNFSNIEKLEVNVDDVFDSGDSIPFILPEVVADSQHVEAVKTTEPMSVTHSFSAWIGNKTHYELPFDTRELRRHDGKVVVSGLPADVYVDNAEHSPVRQPDGTFTQTIDFDRVGDYHFLNIGRNNNDDFEVNFELHYESEGKPVATVVKGLPAGVQLAGAVQPPVLDKDGTYFQRVDSEALDEGKLDLVSADGFFGDLDLKVVNFFGEGDSLTTKETDFHTQVKASDDSLLFAKAGGFSVLKGHGEAQGWVGMDKTPLELAINPKIENATVTLSGFTSNIHMYLADGTQVKTYQGPVTLSVEDAQGIYFQSGGDREFDLNVEVNGTYQGESIHAEQSTRIQNVDIRYASNDLHQNDGTVMWMHDDYDNWNFERVGNELVFTNKNDENDVVTIDMTQVDNVRFNDGWVASEDYTQTLDVSSLINKMDHQKQTDSNTLLVISGLPDGAIVDNSVALGNGAFGVRASDVADGSVNLDFNTIDANFKLGVNVRAYTMTEQQADFLDGQCKVMGYASAEAYAETGVSASATFGKNGVSVAASAYLDAAMVATAGGSVSLGEVTVAAEVSAEARVSAELSGHFVANKSQYSVGANASAEATASLGANASIETDYIPATGVNVEGSVGVSAYAVAGGESDWRFGEGNYGVKAHGGAEAGMAASADGYASGSLAGLGGGAGGGVSAGIMVGASGGGTAMYSDGVLEFGAEGELALLLGAEVDFDITIDTNGVADTGKLIADGSIKVADAIESGFITTENAVKGGYITAAVAISDFGASAEQLVKDGALSGVKAVTDGYFNAEYAFEKGLLNGGDAINMVVKGWFSAEQMLDKGLLNATDAVNHHLISDLDAIGSGYIEADKAINTGLVTAHEAVDRGLIGLHDAIENTYYSLDNAISDGLTTVDNAINQGWISAENAIKHGFISEADAVGKGFVKGAETVTHYVNPKNWF